MPNRLVRESSPYLQQHAGNPVDWYPWGEEAFARARAQNKPVHLSIGYFACHWCHVMAHECFEDADIARQLNESFVNVKVDRQERPDVDELYQRVIQMMGQSGGWPLTVFLTPEQEPFFAGTYFPPEDRHGRPGFPRLLRGLAMAWHNRQDEVRENCAQFRRGFQAHDEQLYLAAGERRADGPGEAARALAAGTDRLHGGLGGAPKFPNPSCYDLILRVAARSGEPALHAALERTLDAMAAGGIYDHLGGGFARYSVDERWAVPHFEKMLYDNAQLVKLYADAYRLQQRPSWRRVFEECIAYALRDLGHAEGGFFASEDADSEGEEGRYYVWDPAQLRTALGGPDAEFACRAYGVTEQGNFAHGRSVLQRKAALDAQDLARLECVRERLFAARLQRVRPGRDVNILAGWNGLMIQGLCAAYQTTGTRTYLAAALRCADFVCARLAMPAGGLYRAWRDGVATVPGFLDDYSFVANGLLDVYESELEKGDLDRALALVDRMLEKFWDDGLFFAPLDGAPLIHRPIAPFDSACPSGMSEAVLALQRAHALSGRERYLECARRMLGRFEAASLRNAFGFAHLLSAREFGHDGPATIVLAGSTGDTAPLVEAVHRMYLPRRVLVRAGHVPMGEGRPAVDGKAAAYVCRGQTCLPPASSAAMLRACLAP